MTYLIMECQELGDQWECDADRCPVTLTEDWKNWYKTTCPPYYFEVYEFTNGKFNRIKDYDTPIEYGMVFGYYEEDANEPTILQKFPGITNNDKVPKNILKRAKRGIEYDDSLCNCGYITWVENNKLFCYTEYYDNHIHSPF